MPRMTLEPQTVYVDFDDVLCATARGFLEVLETEFGKRVEFEAIVDFDLGRSFDLEPAELERFFELAHEPDVLARFQPLEGAFETLAEWKDAGFEIAVVTGRPPDTREASAAWLAKHEVVHDDLIFVDKYGHAPGGLPLAEVLARDYAWVVEDSFAMALQLAGAGHQVRLLDRPWNRLEATAVGGEIWRCADWAEVRRQAPVGEE